MKKKSISFVIIFCILAAFISPLSAQKTDVKVDGQQIKDLINYMAKDEYMGRKPNTPPFNELLEWAKNKYQEWGVEPGGENGTYFQTVPLTGRRGTYAFNLGVPKLVIDKQEFSAMYGDFTIDDRSTPGKTFKGDVVFVGYGISAPDKGLDEYAGINVTGKFVFMFKGSPNDAPTVRTSFGPAPERDAEESEDWKVESQDSTKLKTAYDKGAAGVIFYDTRTATPGMRFGMGRSTQGKLSFTRDFIIVSSINERVYQRMFWLDPQESSRGFARRMSSIQQDIKKKKPGSFATKIKAEIKGSDSSMMFSPELGNNKCRNVIGKITGSDPVLKNEYIVLGGHYDHLGIRNGQIYNGADDNASGSAVVMEVAHLMKKHNIKLKRTVYFCLWTGEELGLIGSRYWTKNPTDGVSMDNVVTNFNLDMVALGDQIGAPGALNFPKVWEVMTRDLDQDILDALQPSEGGPGGSDHSGFIELGIQAVALMTRGGGGHPDYHDTGDDTYKLEPEILRKTGQFVLQATINLGNEGGSLVIAERQIKYDGMRWNIAPISAEVMGGWSALKVESKADLTKKVNEKITEMKRPAASLSPMMRFRRGGMGRGGRYSVGIPNAEVIGYDVEFLGIAQNVLGFGRIDLKGDDGVWFNNGLTEKGKKAIAGIQDKGVVINLINPTKATFNAVLTAAEKPFIVCGISDFDSDQIAQINDKNVLVAVEFDPADVKGCIESLENMKDKIGDRDNLIIDLKSREGLGDAKKELYMRLFAKGWSKNEIYAISGTGAGRGSRGNFSKLSGRNPMAR